jgi:hypothetical protein
VLHLAVITAGLSPRSGGRRALSLVWECEQGSLRQPAVEADEDQARSNPHHTFCVGELSLTLGMAVVALAAWLQILRFSGVLGG